MSRTAISAHNLSKQYFIGSIKDNKQTLQERIARGLTAPFRRAAGLLRGHATAAANLDQRIWALDDVTFDIEEGQIVGIIGANGSGKSTLLKILSRITEPTRGSATIRGRVGSLLEVGTGFHPELTGRENVYLNGSILGMRKAEVARKFDEIVEFSEVGQFIDTPVKYYSSGMRVRLAFSVAAHVEPEVLVVDEVLAVGDATFRKKCMDRMRDIGSQGATVLFVSHSAQTVTTMCTRAIWLDQGKIVKDGRAMETVAAYLGQGLGLSAERTWGADEAPGGEVARVRAVRLKTEAGVVTDCIDVRERFCVECEIEVLRPDQGVLVLHGVLNGEGTHAFCALDTKNPIWSNQTWPIGRHLVRMWIPANFLQEDTYAIETAVVARTPSQVEQCYIRDLLCFHIVDEFDGTTARGKWAQPLPGVVRSLLEWDMEIDVSDEAKLIPRRNLLNSGT